MRDVTGRASRNIVEVRAMPVHPSGRANATSAGVWNGPRAARTLQPVDTAGGQEYLDSVKVPDAALIFELAQRRAGCGPGTEPGTGRETMLSKSSRRRFSRRSFLGSTAVVSAAVIVAACGGQTPASPTAAPKAADPKPTTAAQPAAQSKPAESKPAESKPATAPQAAAAEGAGPGGTGHDPVLHGRGRSDPDQGVRGDLRRVQAACSRTSASR